MNNLKNDIIDIIDSIITTTDLFYKQKNKEGYENLNNTLGKLIQFTDRLQNNYEKQNFDNNKFNNNLMEVMDCLETKDTVMLSDILVYEITEQLQELTNQL